MLIQRRQLTKTINVFIYEIILTHVYGHLSAKSISKNFCTDLIFVFKYHDIFYCCSIANFAEKKERRRKSLFLDTIR